MEGQQGGAARREPSVVVALRERFPDAVEEVTNFRGQLTIRVRATEIAAICTYLRDEPEWRFDMLGRPLRRRYATAARGCRASMSSTSSTRSNTIGCCG